MSPYIRIILQRITSISELFVIIFLSGLLFFQVEPKLQPLKKLVLRLSRKPAPRKPEKKLSKNETRDEFYNSTLNETMEQWQEKSNDVIHEDENGEQRSGSTKESEGDNVMEDEEVKDHKETTKEEDDDNVQRDYDDFSDGEL